MSRRLSMVGFAAFLLLLGCGDKSGPSYVVEASDFDQSCSFDSECTLVTTGDFCGCTACSKGAIAKSAREAYSAEVETAIDACEGESRGCPSLTEERATQSLSCVQVRAMCDQGTCIAQRSSDVTTGDVSEVVDRSCQIDSDCTTVPESFDEPCGCRVAINSTDEFYAEEVARSQGGYSVASCDCATEPQPVRCVAGSCEIEGTAACEVTAWNANSCQ